MIVIGAGIAGLTFARELAVNGVHVTVLDAGEAAGGVLLQRSLGDLNIDAGAEAFAVSRPEARELIDELGLGALVEKPTRSDAHLALPGTLASLPTGLLGIPVDVSDERVRTIIGEEAAAQANEQDQSLMPVPPTIGALVRQHLGDPVTDLLVDPVISGVHASRADEAELDTVIPRMRDVLARGATLQQAALELRGGLGSAGAAVASLRGGMSVLPRHLVDAIARTGSEVRLESPARSVVARTSGGWSVVTDDGAIETEDVCVAVPARQAARVLVGLGEVGIALSRVGLTSVVVVALLVDTASLDDAPVGSGVLVAPTRSDVRAKAMTHATAKWAWLAEQAGPGTHVLRLSYGRAGEPITATDAELITSAINDAARLSGADITPATVSHAWVQRWEDSLIDPRVGHAALMREVRAHTAVHTGLTLTGSCLGGNGIAGIVADARAAAHRYLDAHR